jgi:DNA (cytosine-5)-methyltransferase 3A
MVVLSLFDGMSCGQLALQRCGIPVEKYYASEIDKFAIKVTKHNFPNTIHIGDVRQIDSSSFNDPIDMVIGGSPCQSFSFAGRRNGMTTVDNIEITSLEQYLELKKANFEFQGESYLFWEFVRIVNELKPKYFFLENVMMEERWSSLITQTLGVHPLEINSRLLSAQNRKRLYWTNIGLKPQGLFGDMHQSIEQPKDLGILLKDILQDNPNAKHYLSEEWSKTILSSQYNRIIKDINTKTDTLLSRQSSGSDMLGIIDEKYFLSEKMISWLDKHSKKLNAEIKFTEGDRKSSSLTCSGLSKVHLQSDFIVHNLQRRSENRPSIEKNKNAGGSGHLSKADGKSYCLDVSNSMAIETTQNNIYNKRIRRLTPIECERLQTVPDNYTSCVSDAQRYKMLGNGWTIDVIAHIFKHIEK